MWLARPPHLFLSPSSRSTVCSLPCNSFGQLLQPLLQLQGEFLVALLTHRLHVKLHKLVPVGERVKATVTGWKLDVITHSMQMSVSVLCEKWFSNLLVCSYTLELWQSYISYRYKPLRQQHKNWNVVWKKQLCGQKWILWMIFSVTDLLFSSHLSYYYLSIP